MRLKLKIEMTDQTLLQIIFVGVKNFFHHNMMNMTRFVSKTFRWTYARRAESTSIDWCFLTISDLVVIFVLCKGVLFVLEETLKR